MPQRIWATRSRTDSPHHRIIRPDPESGCTAAPLVDTHHLDNELAREGELLAELRELFEAKAVEQIAELDRRLHAGDLSGAAEQAHSLAGMAGTMGLERLRQCGLDLERHVTGEAPLPERLAGGDPAAWLREMLRESLRALDDHLLQRA